jgi:hypothetical protein
LNDDYLALPELPGTTGAHLFGSNKKLELQQAKGAVLLHLPAELRDPVDTIVVLEKSR